MRDISAHLEKEENRGAALSVVVIMDDLFNEIGGSNIYN